MPNISPPTQKLPANKDKVNIKLNISVTISIIFSPLKFYYPDPAQDPEDLDPDLGKDIDQNDLDPDPHKDKDLDKDLSLAQAPKREIDLDKDQVLDKDLDKGLDLYLVITPTAVCICHVSNQLSELLQF
jgi:hypothetical protein